MLQNVPNPVSTAHLQFLPDRIKRGSLRRLGREAASSEGRKRSLKGRSGRALEHKEAGHVGHATADGTVPGAACMYVGLKTSQENMWQAEENIAQAWGNMAETH